MAVWAMPFLTVPLGTAGLPVSAVRMLALAGRLLWRLSKADERDASVRAEEVASAEPRLAAQG